MLDLELLIGLGGNLDLVANAVIDLWLGLDGAPDDLISENGFVDNSVEWTRR